MSTQSLIQKNVYVNNEVLVIGLDIGSRFHVAVGSTTTHGYTKPLRVNVSKEGFAGLLTNIRKWQHKFNCSEVIVGLESTGIYWKSIYSYLQKNGISVVEVPSINTNRMKEVFHGAPIKTDAGDACVIADLTRQGKTVRLLERQEKYLELKGILEMYQTLVDERTRLKNRMRDIVEVIFPESAQAIKNLYISKSGLNILLKYPTPEDILKAGIRKVIRIVKKSSHNRLTEHDAIKLYRLAQETIGVSDGIGTMKRLLQMFAARMLEIKEQITTVEKELRSKLSEVEGSQRILSVPGIGLIGCATILAETGGLHNFNHAKQVIKLAGLNLCESSSGLHQGKRFISHRGRKTLRQILYMLSMKQASKGMPLHSKYRSMVERGVPKPKALVAISTKLIRILFAMSRDNTEFSAMHFAA